MDGTQAIERNREALKRILAGVIAMASLPVLRACGDAGIAGGRPTLPRRLHRAILRLLRPAEAAARRLIIAAARGLVVALLPSAQTQAEAHDRGASPAPLWHRRRDDSRRPRARRDPPPFTGEGDRRRRWRGRCPAHLEPAAP